MFQEVSAPLWYNLRKKKEKVGNDICELLTSSGFLT